MKFSLTILFVLLFACAPGLHSEASAQTFSVPVGTVETTALALRTSAATAERIGNARRHRITGIQRIVIDPGHGGRNEGAIGVGNVHEKHLTLPVAVHLADRLRAEYPHLEVILTRHADVELGLSERAEVANEADADLFISLHLNAATNPEAIGFETYWVLDASPMLPHDRDVFTGLKGVVGDLPALAQRRVRSADRAHAFLTSLHAAFNARLDVMDRGIKQGNYTVLRRSNVPAVVVELGFLTHESEGLDMLSPSYQARLVDGLLEAVGSYDVQLTAELEQALAAD